MKKIILYFGLTMFDHGFALTCCLLLVSIALMAQIEQPAVVNADGEIDKIAHITRVIEEVS